MRETDLLAWASFSFFINYHPLTDLTLIHFLSPILKYVHTLTHVAKTKFSLLKLFIYWYVLPQVSGGTLKVPPIRLSDHHPHAYQEVHGKDHPLPYLSCANRCSFKRAENYVSNISGACFKEFMFCIWNGRRSTVYTLNNLSSQAARLRYWISISLISPVLVYLFHHTFPHFYSRGERTGFSPSFSLAPAMKLCFSAGTPQWFWVVNTAF